MPTSLPQVHLVDITGFDVPCTERAHGPEPDPTDPSNWGPEWDNWYYTPTDSAELMAAEAEAFADMADLPSRGYGEQLWAQLMVEGSLPSICGGAPEPFVPSDEDWADYLAWTAEVERRDALRRDENARHPLYGNE